jgi:hemolysin activation/secretion protein
VRAIRFEGAVLISPRELEQAFASHLGSEMTYPQLQALTAAVTRYYAQRGFLARAVLPPQEIKDGVVVLRIVEGKLGKIMLKNNSERIPADWVRQLFDHYVGGSEFVKMIPLGEAISILNDQPGLKAGTELVRGTGEGYVDVAVDLAEKPLLNGSLAFNNQASRATGEYQAQGALSLNNLSGNLDAASLLMTSTHGTTFARADYNLPVGASGLRLSLNASNLRYRVTLAELAALNPNGSAATYGIGITYPAVRENEFVLTVTANADTKSLIDRTTAGETSNRDVQVTALGVNGWFIPSPDTPLGGGITSFGATLSAGTSHQQNATALAADSGARQIEGGFTKLGYTLGHLRQLPGNWSLNASLRGQFAGKNLDSTERFSLGGPGGIRAYPVGEGAGDEGWLLSLNFQRPLADGLSATLFLDTGGITVNRKVYAGWNATDTRLGNRYELTGIGAGLDWRLAANTLLNATLAAPLGSNPGRDANNRNADSRDNHPRLWLSLNAQF